MKNFIVHNLDGKILRSGTCEEDFIALQASGENEISMSIKNYVDAMLMFVKEGELQEKKDYILQNLPIPCHIRIENKEYFVETQPIFEFDTPGTYTIRVIPDSVQYLEKEFEYVVEA